MSSLLVTRPDPAAPTQGRPDDGRGGRLRPFWVAVAVVAALAGLAITATPTTLSVAPQERVAISFPDDPNAVESDWGNEDVYGAAGSYVLAYEHDDRTTMALPWRGGELSAARLGDAEHNLLTVDGVEQDDDTLLVGITIGNCRYFHERAIDIYTGIDLTLADGSTQVVAFDKPLLVKSPMLASCPDRTLDRGDDARGETFRRGG